MSFATTRRFTLQSAVAPGQSVSFACPDDLGLGVDELDDLFRTAMQIEA